MLCVHVCIDLSMWTWTCIETSYQVSHCVGQVKRVDLHTCGNVLRETIHYVENVLSISGTGYDEVVSTNNIVFLYVIADPYRAKKFTVLVSTVSSLILTWDAPDIGGLTKYRVTLEGGNTVKTQTPDKDTTTVVFTGLTAGTEYTAGLVTLNVDQQSAKVEDAVYTSKSADVLFLSLASLELFHSY